MGYEADDDELIDLNVRYMKEPEPVLPERRRKKAPAEAPFLD